jgi:DHA1 family multidrug resistance protein-like MFS transporter
MSSSLRNFFNIFRVNEAFLILCVQVFVLHIGQSLIVPILPLYAQSFSVSVTLVGFLLTMQALPRVFANIPAGQLADRWGAHRMLAIAAGTVTLSAVAGALSPNYVIFLLTRLVQGVGTAISQTAGLTYAANVSRPENRGRFISIFQGSFLLGNSIGPLIGGIVAQYFGYRAPFWVYAALSLLVGVWMMARLPDPRIAGNVDAHRKSRPNFWVSMRNMLRHPGVLWACIIGLVVAYTRSGSRDLALVLLGKNIGASESQIGLALSIIFVMNVIVLYSAGTLADRYGSKAVIVPSLLLTGAGLWFLAIAPQYTFFLLAASVYGLAAGISSPVPAAYVVEVVDEASQGQALGLFRTFNDIGLVFGPALMGWIGDQAGMNTGVLVNAGVVIVVAAIFFFFAPSKTDKVTMKSVETHI